MEEQRAVASLHRKLQQQDCGSCEKIFYSAFRHQMAAADSWRVYTLQYNTEYRYTVYINTYTVYRLQVTGYRLQVYVIHNSYTPFGATDVLYVHIDTSGTSTYEST